MVARTVGVIGAGASGLAAAKVLLEDGFDVTIFDRQKTLGGIWSPDSAYADLHTQALAGFMEFSNLPDTDAKDYASWQSTHKYLLKYADKFHLVERIRFQTKVLLINKDDLKNANRPWIIKVETANGDHQTFNFDFVVVASGLFSTPFVPVFRNQTKFSGSIVHANEIKTYEQFENKHVTIIGSGKSAIDLASLAGKYARSCHMIFRRPHWLIPHDLVHGYLPSTYIFTRLFTVMFDPFPYAPHSVLFRFFHRTCSILINKIFNSMANDIIATYRIDLFQDKAFIPKGSIRNSENVMRLTDDFLKLTRQGRIIRKVASVDEIIDGTTIRLDSGETLPVDMIVCATGFTEQFCFLSETLSRALGQNPTISPSTEGIDLDLYRRIIPVGIPNIAFVGLAAAANTWMHSEIQSHWISDYFLGRLQLPKTEKEMYEEIQVTRTFIQQLFHRKSYYLQYYWLEPIEIYLQDMGVPLHRTNNWISEYFGIYRSKRIASLHDERQAKAQGKTTNRWQRHWYFGFQHTVLFLLILMLFFFFIF